MLHRGEIMYEVIDIIKDNQLFNNISKAEIRQILKCGKARVEEYKDNQIVFQKDDNVKKFGIILEGQFNLVSWKFNGTRAIVTTLEQNDLFGEALAFSSSKEAPYDLVSSGNSKALILPYSVFFTMCREVCNFHKILINNMLSILADKIVLLNNKMHILNTETLRGRIAMYLLTLHKKNNSVIFDMTMKRQELADFLNVKRPSLSRELSKMQQENIIEVQRSTVKIIDMDTLKELAD